MSVMRSVLLAASDSRWMRQQAPRMGFVKKAVKRFMPGEHVEDALQAAQELKPQGIATILTKLGENITVTPWPAGLAIGCTFLRCGTLSAGQFSKKPSERNTAPTNSFVIR